MTTIKLDRKYPAWVGERSRLLAIATAIAAESGSIAEAAIQQLRTRIDDPSDVTLQRVRDESLPRIELQERADGPTHKGGMEVFEDEAIEWARVREFEIRIGTVLDEQRILVRANWFGVHLIVEGEHRWARSAVAVLAPEIEKCAPWWTHLRSMWVIALLCFTPMLSSMVSMGWNDYWESLDKSSAGFTSPATWLGGLLVFGAIASIRFIMPGVEVVRDGQRPRGYAAVVIVALFLLGIAGNLIASAISG